MPQEAFALRFRFLDTDHLELGFQAAASLKSPKDSPSVFSANNLIYALDSPCSGNFDSTFERYDPESDEWEVLPKPPVKPASLSRCEINWCDCATVVNDTSRAVGRINLEPVRKDNLQASTQELKLVKAGPLPPSAALTSNFSFPAHVRVMATRKELDQGLSLPTDNYIGWREIFHLGGRFFCYVVTTRIGCDPGLDQFHGVQLPALVFCVKFSRYASYVISGSDDTNLRLWKAKASEQLGVFLPRESNQHEYRESAKNRYKHLP
ncbi:hypothetical protein POM88_004862 [Heracleum sosnowskyi]|uniref:Sof1-like protein domain-containing protein n=1 Tax=Heracleum sosnowskyi TaxID=360622 RepID=A0AAD8NDV1_9APIA|nr:hypothetical protein POM88_004862 [Heracleum sosnowskyi]